VRLWLQRLQKVPIRPKKIFQNNSIGVSKNAEFDAVFEYIEKKLGKKLLKKVLGLRTFAHSITR
jgi:hypothetical protein